ncbi:MAG TPA: cysteine synthase family protein [Tepidisphaeraceae bacterium]|jgi:cysteine synthase A|nr:cysteine synthase family protein [Tepidisphaeraceae bacterium]
MSPSTPNFYLDAIAPTPLVPVRLDPGAPQIWCKLEFLNPSGSTKDRIARYILSKALRDGNLRPGQWVVEASSGSTSIAMALACAQLGAKFLAVMPEGVSNERVLLIRAYGGEIKFSPREAGVVGAIAESEQIARDRGAYLPRQFENSENADAHRIYTAGEILAQMPAGSIDAVVSGVGTGGTLVGLYEGLVVAHPALKPIVARPISGSIKRDLECCSLNFSCRIPGVADCISGIFRRAKLPGMVEINVSDEDAIQTTRALIRLGFPVGPSSGLNFSAAIAAHTLIGKPNARILTVFPDRMERYFSTELFLSSSR